MKISVSTKSRGRSTEVETRKAKVRSEKGLTRISVMPLSRPVKTCSSRNWSARAIKGTFRSRISPLSRTARQNSKALRGSTSQSQRIMWGRIVLIRSIASEVVEDSAIFRTPNSMTMRRIAARAWEAVATISTINVLNFSRFVSIGEYE